MRRKRHRETRVWHDPLVSPGRHKGGARQQQRPANDGERKGDDERDKGAARRRSARIIAGPASAPDPDEVERRRLLERLLLAEGRAPITAATNAYLEAGHALPNDQEVLLQVLEHRDEERVRHAVGRLAELLVDEPPRRRAVLESRLRRLEEYADEPATQQVASALRRQLSQLPMVAPA